MKNIKRTIQLVQENQSRLITITIISIALDAAVPILETFISAYIISVLLMFDWKKASISSFLFGIVIFICNLLKKKVDMLKKIQERAFYFRQKQIAASKVMDVDYKILESPKYNEMLRKLEDLHELTGYRINSFIDVFFQFIGNCMKVIFTFISAIIVFWRLNIEIDIKNIVGKFIIFGFIFLILTFFINIILSTKRSEKIFEYSTDMISLNKSIWYYDNIYFDDYRNGKDIRIYNQSDFLGELYTKALKHSEMLNFKMGCRQGISAAVSSILQNVNLACVYILLTMLVIIKKVTLDNIVFYVGIFLQILNGMENAVNNAVQLKEVMVYINRYWEIMDFDLQFKNKEKTDKKLNLSDIKDINIQFCNVSYDYGDNFSLKNISFTIQGGQKIALVGLNGAGKTTLIKLLCRLYTPMSGEIKLNGININEYKWEDYIKIISAVFQDFNLFSFTLGQNIAANDIYIKELAEQVLKNSGLENIQRNFPNGFDTYLYNNFGEQGIEISGGEEQKIAIARALYKNSPILILDEPTAALDPISEDEIYKYINKNAGEKTIIYISHRLSACKFADKIMVLDNGELVQFGTHEELLKDTSSRYYKMWCAQAYYYK